MKAKKRTNRPTQWDFRPPTHLYVIARKRGRICTHLKEISAISMSDARRKAFLMFTQFDVNVYTFDQWQEMVEDFEYEKRENERKRKNEKTKKPSPPEPKPMTEAQRIEARKIYARLKADYLAGKPVDCSDRLKQQFEAFRPRQTPIAVVSDLESSHRTKPISKHKWRPLQSGFSVTEVCKIMEHMDDNDHETA